MGNARGTVSCAVEFKLKEGDGAAIAYRNNQKTTALPQSVSIYSRRN